MKFMKFKTILYTKEINKFQFIFVLIKLNNMYKINW